MSRRSTKRLLDVLVSKNILQSDKIAGLEQKVKSSGKSIDAILIQEKIIDEEGLYKIRGEIFGLPFISLVGQDIAPDVLRIIPRELAENYKIAVFGRQNDEIKVVMTDPTNLKAVEAVEFIVRENKLKVQYFITTPTALNQVLKKYESLTSEVEEALGEVAVKYKDTIVSDKRKEGVGFDEVIKAAPVAKMVATIIEHGVESGASDIHIEPGDEESRVRYRIDGMLHVLLRLPKYIHSALVSRIKVMANLKIDETRIPQDGRIRLLVEGKDVDFRVSSLPLTGQEKVVLRILDTSSGVYTLKALGFNQRQLDIMDRNIKRPHGMFLVTGPTGSGKSTTLYSALNILNQEGVNIVTLEDPVEYHLAGINQSQVNADVGLSFAAGLRSILRQDPDVVMVGEIRDNETAELAIHAALTGHMVLSTLHTNSAFGAIPRLIDMKVEPFLLASTLNVIVAQRLVRKICEHCKEEYDPPADVRDGIKKGIEEIKKVDSAYLDGILPPKFYHGKGCRYCSNLGYKGRTVISEVLGLNDIIKNIITSGYEGAEAKIRDEFLKQKMLLIKHDGVIKALKGITSMEEVLRATRD